MKNKTLFDLKVTSFFFAAHRCWAAPLQVKGRWLSILKDLHNELKRTCVLGLLALRLV